jgi:Holliday junction DNA helicase RuvB
MNYQESKAASKELLKVDAELDRALRPRQLADFIGQDKIKENLSIFIEAAKVRGGSLDHVLLSGPPGLGKTTLAGIISHELDVRMTITSGPALESKKDIASILTNLEKNDVLFIDEIHRISRPIEEMLYPALEDFALDILLGSGLSARPLRFELKPFTLIGATTRSGLLTSPLRDRFGVTFRLDYYSEEEIAVIIRRSAKLLRVMIEDSGADALAIRCRGTPRIANRLLKRVFDFAIIRSDGTINEKIVNDSLNMLEIDEMGLDSLDIKILDTIIKKFNGGPVGLNTLSVSIEEETDTIEDVYEPYLLRQGLIQRTSRGRVATKKAYEHLGIEVQEGRLF